MAAGNCLLPGLGIDWKIALKKNILNSLSASTDRIGTIININADGSVKYNIPVAVDSIKSFLVIS